MKLLFISVLAGGLIFQQPALAQDAQKLATANNAFAFNFLKELAQEQPAQNLFVCPYSAATVLQMVENGAAGTTKAEMQKVLGTTGWSEEAISAGHQAIARSLSHDNPQVILTTANAIWYRQGAPVNPAFIARNERYFGATVAPLDFFAPQAVETINRWASDQTQGRITHLADGMLNVPSPRLFLANAVYFKAKWAEPFEIKATKDRPFHRRDGSQKSVPMMTQTQKFSYRRGTGYQAVRLPYQGDNLGLYVFLPDAGSSPENLLQLMNGDTWKRVTKPGFSPMDGTLVLPRFKSESTLELKTSLQALGMKTAFGEEADFSGITDGIAITSARQKTFIEVKEEGTEAAAVTAVLMQDSAIPMPALHPFEMIVDRPFLYLIEDRVTGTILFMGVLFDPKAE